MVKANKWFEAIGLEKFFYKDWDIIYVRLPTNNVEKHYYPVTTKGVILVSNDPTEALQNPQIKDTGKVTIDSKTKRNVYQWIKGRQYATPLFSSEQMTKPLINDEDVDHWVNIGIAWDKLTNPKKDKKNDPLNSIFIIIIIMLIAQIITLFLVYQIADKAGIIKGLVPGT